MRTEQEIRDAIGSALSSNPVSREQLLSTVNFVRTLRWVLEEAGSNKFDQELSGETK